MSHNESRSGKPYQNYACFSPKAAKASVFKYDLSVMPSTVLLTGGNGFIAVHILNLLLSHGHSVVATVRSESKTTYLRQKFATEISSGQLTFSIVEDITIPGAFDEVLKSNQFDAVLHTSSPFVFKDLLDPAILGTIGILKSIKAYAPTVKRVVITSSIVSIIDRGKGDRPGYVYSEKDWNPITYEEAQKDAVSGYYGSKTLAEQSAWKFMEDEKPTFELTTICPPMVYGPAFQEVNSTSHFNTSSTGFYAIFSGQQKALTNGGVWLWVDVRDVALAHVAAFEEPGAANERFFVCEGRYNINQVVDYIWKHYPERAEIKGIPKPTRSADFPAAGTYYADNSKSKAVLRLEYTSFEAMLKDTLEQFVTIERGLGIE